METALLIGVESSLWRDCFGFNLLYHLGFLQPSFGPFFLPSPSLSLREGYNTVTESLHN